MAENENQPRKQGSLTESSFRGWIIGLAVALVLLTIGVALIPAPEVNAADSAGILAIVTAGAVGIERVMEMVWTFVGMRRGTWWPLKPIGARLDELVERLNDDLVPLYEDAKEVVGGAGEAAKRAEKGLKSAEDYLEELGEQVANLKQLSPSDSGAQEFAAKASRAVVGLKKHYPGQLQNRVDRAEKVLAGVNAFVLTFEDNPARRLMSIFLGAILGLVFAGVLGLDVIQAALGSEPYRGLGVAATGLLMGLGAGPTHEAIKTLQEAKKRRKSYN